MHYIKNSFCGEILDGEYTLIIIHDTGNYLKLRTNIWNNIQYYIENDIEIDVRLKGIFDVLLEYGIILEDNSTFLSKYKSLILQMTSGCNLKCVHCCATTINAFGNVGYDVVNKVIELNPETLALSGGEPMLHPRFWKMVEYIGNNYNGTLALMTNGTLIRESNLDALCYYFDYFDISIDGMNSKAVTRIRGEGVYEKVIDSIKLLKKRNKKIGLSMVSEKGNDEIKEFFLLADSLGVSPVIRTLNVVDRVKDNFDKVVLGGKEAYIDSTIRLLRNSLQNDINLASCGMVKHELYVDVNGNLYPCGSLAEDRFCIGNIKNMSDLPDYYSVVQILLQDKTYQKCKKCKYREGCWECLGEVISYSQVEEVFAEYCKCSQKKWENILESDF